MTNKYMKSEVVRIALIFLMAGLSLGGGTVLCLLNVVPILSVGATALNTISSVVVLYGVIVSIIAAVLLRKFCHTLVTSDRDIPRKKVIVAPKDVNVITE